MLLTASSDSCSTPLQWTPFLAAHFTLPPSLAIAVDRIIFLHEGRVVWQGTVEEFDTTGKHALLRLLLLFFARAISGCLECLFGMWMMP